MISLEKDDKSSFSPIKSTLSISNFKLGKSACASRVVAKAPKILEIISFIASKSSASTSSFASPSPPSIKSQTAVANFGGSKKSIFPFGETLITAFT